MRSLKLTASFNRLTGEQGPRIISCLRSSQRSSTSTSITKEFKLYDLTTAIPVSEDLKNEIIAKVQEQAGTKNIDLTTAVDEAILGGFKLEVGDTLVDASISYDLNKIRAQFLNNDFIYKIR